MKKIKHKVLADRLAQVVQSESKEEAKECGDLCGGAYR